jgi:hypothetical protein
VRFFSQEKFYWGIRETRKRRLWKRTTLSIGAPFGNLEGVVFPGDSREMGGLEMELSQGNLEEGHFYWGPRRICKEDSGNRHLSPQGHCWGTWKGAHLLGTLKDR